MHCFVRYRLEYRFANTDEQFTFEKWSPPAGRGGENMTSCFSFYRAFRFLPLASVKIFYLVVCISAAERGVSQPKHVSQSLLSRCIIIFCCRIGKESILCTVTFTGFSTYRLVQTFAAARRVICPSEEEENVIHCGGDANRW